MSNDMVKTAQAVKADTVEVVPLVDIVENSDGFELIFEVPGANAGSVQVEVANNVLTVEAASSLRRGERSVVFKRAFQLSYAINVMKITAETKDGVLRLFLPKADQAKVHRIPVA